MARQTIEINRAPVLTLWAAVVAERLGFDADEALTLGKTLAGLNAQAKGRRLGIFKPSRQAVRQTREKKPGEELHIDLLGRAAPATTTDAGIRAVNRDRIVEPESVQRYLEGKFGEDLSAAKAAMAELAAALDADDLADRAFSLYEQFRPQIPSGRRGWGAKGPLDLDQIRSLAPAG